MRSIMRLFLFITDNFRPRLKSFLLLASYSFSSPDENEFWKRTRPREHSFTSGPPPPHERETHVSLNSRADKAETEFPIAAAFATPEPWRPPLTRQSSSPLRSPLSFQQINS